MSHNKYVCITAPLFKVIVETNLAFLGGLCVLFCEISLILSLTTGRQVQERQINNQEFVQVCMNMCVGDK